MSVHLIRGWPLAWLLWPALVGAQALQPAPAMPPQKPPRNSAPSTQNTLPRWKAVFSVPTGISIRSTAKPT